MADVIGFLSDFGDENILWACMGIISIGLASRRCWNTLGAWLVLAFMTFGSVLVCKLGLEACGRVPGRLVYSVSGHTAGSTFVYGGAAVLFLRRRVPAVLLAVLTAVVIGVSRVVVGAHDVAEVVAGAAIGLAGVYGLLLTCRRKGADASLTAAGRIPALILIGAILAAAGLLHGVRSPIEHSIEAISRHFVAPVVGCPAPPGPVLAWSSADDRFFSRVQGSIMTSSQNIAIAALQGVTELFPVSSLGHALIIPALLGWHADPSPIAGLPFLVVLHLGTTLALLGFFWRDWASLIRHVGGRGDRARVAQERRLAVLLVVATLPAIVLGAVVEHVLRALFSAPLAAACFLVANGVLLGLCETLRRGRRDRPSRDLASLTMQDAIWIGLAQCLAFFPGISRSGSTISAGFLRGLSHESAARFSFLLAPFIIGAATVLQVIRLHHVPGALRALGGLWFAGLVAGLAALVSTTILMRWFRDHENGALWPFSLYCVLVGTTAIVLLG